MKLRNDNKGLTLIEVLVSIGIFVIIGSVLVSFIIQMFRFNASTWGRLTQHSVGQRAMRIMIEEIRQSDEAENGALAIYIATSTEFAFYSDVDSNGETDWVHYRLIGTNLERAVVAPVGNPSTYATTTEQFFVLAGNVMNTSLGTPVFEYYNTTYTGSESPMVNPTPVFVRAVRMQLEIDTGDSLTTTTLLFDSVVHMRNLKL